MFHIFSIVIHLAGFGDPIAKFNGHLSAIMNMDFLVFTWHAHSHVKLSWHPYPKHLLTVGTIQLVHLHFEDHLPSTIKDGIRSSHASLHNPIHLNNMLCDTQCSILHLTIGIYIPWYWQG